MAQERFFDVEIIVRYPDSGRFRLDVVVVRAASEVAARALALAEVAKTLGQGIASRLEVVFVEAG